MATRSFGQLRPQKKLCSCVVSIGFKDHLAIFSKCVVCHKGIFSSVPSSEIAPCLEIQVGGAAGGFVDPHEILDFSHGWHHCQILQTPSAGHCLVKIG